MKLPMFSPIIIIIATSFSRTELLLARSLKSVYQQINIIPQHLYIVDDNPIPKGKKYSTEYSKIKKGIRNLRAEILRPKFELCQQNNQTIAFKNFFQTTLIPNTRTKQFSGTGAWNSAAFEAFKNHSAKGDFFLAFLDDDDEWEKNYLATLDAQVIKSKIKQSKVIAAIAGIKRIEPTKRVVKKMTQKNFNKESFFIGNPGLQGSNLFIDLKTFWTIGGFDESLKSATDRDLAIRLIEYKTTYPQNKIIFIDDILVKHYTDSQNRVTAIFNNKQQGLDFFYRKYFHQFPQRQQIKSLKRAKTLFDYELFAGVSSETKNRTLSSPLEATAQQELKPFDLIIGTISASEENLIALFESFLNLYQKHGTHLNNYQFLILENSPEREKIKSLIDHFILKKKLNITLIQNISSGRSIAENRTLLQQKILEQGQKIFNHKNYITWIIDDDILFEYEDENNKRVIPNYFKFISQYSSAKIDALFGQVSETPPLPFLSTLRCQLIDFYYHLTYFANCNTEQDFKLQVAQKEFLKGLDFYYDLSSTYFQHLEYPYYENFKKQKNFKAFKTFLKKTSSLSNGENPFRKIIFNSAKFGEITNSESIFRGGNTIIFNSKLLKIPNYSPNNIRRSDFNWAIINKYLFKHKLCEVNLPLKHNRTLQKISFATNVHKFKLDIQGAIFYRLLESILSQSNWADESNYTKPIKFYQQIEEQFFFKIQLSNYRIDFLSDLILAILENKKLWWFKKEYQKILGSDIQNNIEIIKYLKAELLKNNLTLLENNLKIDKPFISKVKLEIKKIVKK